MEEREVVALVMAVQLRSDTPTLSAGSVAPRHQEPLGDVRPPDLRSGDAKSIEQSTGFGKKCYGSTRGLGPCSRGSTPCFPTNALSFNGRTPGSDPDNPSSNLGRAANSGVVKRYHGGLLIRQFPVRVWAHEPTRASVNGLACSPFKR